MTVLIHHAHLRLCMSSPSPSQMCKVFIHHVLALRVLILVCLTDERNFPPPRSTREGLHHLRRAVVGGCCMQPPLRCVLAACMPKPTRGHGA